MKVEIKKDYVLFTNENGEYHLTHEKFNELGEEAAKEFAASEIEKKQKTDLYKGETINFDQARELGFCEYGIEDFCEKLDLNTSETYEISFLLEKLTPGVFLSYTDECRRLFGKDRIMAKFGGVKKFLSENRTREALDFVLSNNFLPEKPLHILACDFAERVLPIYEKDNSGDNRPRRAIEVKRLWIEEEYKNESA